MSRAGPDRSGRRANSPSSTFRHCGKPAHLVRCAAYKANEGIRTMKRAYTILAATALLALAACASRTANNTAAVDTGNDVYNVSPDDLTVNDMGNGSGNASGNSASSTGNGMSSGNSSSASHAGGGNSASSHAGNSH